MYQIANGLITGARYAPTPNLSAGHIRPDLGVIHYTAGGTLAGAVATLQDPASRASAHVVIDRDGTVVQLAPFHRRAWHAGTSVWQGRPDVNGYAIGIELVNWGWLERAGDRWLSWSGQLVHPQQVLVATHRSGGRERGWQTYPDVQVRAAAEVARAINAEYRLTPDDWVGHDDIAPRRKTDPGPAWDWDRFRGLLDPRDAAATWPRATRLADSHEALRTTLAALLRDVQSFDFRDTTGEQAARLLQEEIGLTGDDIDAIFGPQTRRHIAAYLADAALALGDVAPLDP